MGFIASLKAVLSWNGVSADAGIKETRRQLAELQQNIRTVQKGFSDASAVAGFAAKATLPFVAATALGIREAASFEQQMSAVNAKLDDSEKNTMPALIARARELGRTTKFSGVEIGQGMEVMAAAGFKAQDVIAGIGSVANLAAADNIGLGESASFVSDILNAWGMTGKDVTHVADVLATASNATNTSISGLAESLKYSQATAKAMGLTFEEAIVTLATFSNTGVKGSMAGTSFNQALAHINSGLAKLKEGKLNKVVKAFNALKIGKKGLEKIFTSDNKMLSLAATIAERTKGKSAQEMLAISDDLTKIFGEQGGRIIRGLVDDMQKGKPVAVELAQKIKDAAGASAKMAQTRLDNFLGDLALLKSAAIDLTISVFGPITQALRPGLQSIKEYIGGVSSGIMYLRETNAGTKAELKKTWDALPKHIKDSATNANKQIDGFVTSIKGLGKSFESMMGKFNEKGFTAGFVTFTAKLWAASLVVSPVATGISAITSAISKLVPAMVALRSASKWLMPLLKKNAFSKIAGLPMWGQAGLVAAAGVLGWEIGTLINKYASDAIQRALDWAVGDPSVPKAPWQRKMEEGSRGVAANRAQNPFAPVNRRNIRGLSRMNLREEGANSVLLAPGDNVAKAVSEATKAKAEAKKKEPCVDVTVNPATVDNTIKLVIADREITAIVAKTQQEYHERAGFRTPYYQRRKLVEHHALV